MLIYIDLIFCLLLIVQFLKMIQILIKIISIINLIFYFKIIILI